MDASNYLPEVVRYIHFNPVYAGLVARAGDYRWSSHRTFMGEAPLPWLSQGLIHPYLGSLAEPTAFDEFVHSKPAQNVHRELTEKRWKPAFGSDEFIETVRKQLRIEGLVQDEEIRGAWQMLALEPREVIEAAVGVSALQPLANLIVVEPHHRHYRCPGLGQGEPSSLVWVLEVPSGFQMSGWSVLSP